MMASQRVGAGEGNRTLDIQLGKLTRIMHEDEIFVTAVAQSERFT